MAPWGPNDSKPTLEPSPPSGIVFPPPPPAASGDARSLPICLRWIPATAARESQGPQRRLDRRGPHCPPPGGFQQLTSKPFLVSQDYPASELDSWGGGFVKRHLFRGFLPRAWDPTTLYVDVSCWYVCARRSVSSPSFLLFPRPGTNKIGGHLSGQPGNYLCFVLALLSADK